MLIRPIPMNEQDASPGGGTVPPAPASPAASPGAAPATPTFDPSLIKSAVSEAFGELRNGLFADLRKAGALKSEKSNPSSDPTPAPAAASSPTTGMTAAEVQTMMARQRAFDRVVASAGLSDAQIAAVENVFHAVNPQDASTWVTDFVKTMGLGKGSTPPAAAPAATPTAPAPTPTPVAPAPAQNISDRGPPTAGENRDVDSLLETNPLGMTRHDIERLYAKHGREKGNEMFQRAALAAMKGLKPTR